VRLLSPCASCNPTGHMNLSGLVVHSNSAGAVAGTCCVDVSLAMLRHVA
jgi:hypothetical protein